MESFLHVVEILAVLAFAYSGVIEARKSGFDYVGVLTIAVVTAFGGGTLRDLLLNRTLLDRALGIPDLHLCFLSSRDPPPAFKQGLLQRKDNDADRRTWTGTLLLVGSWNGVANERSDTARCLNWGCHGDVWRSVMRRFMRPQTTAFPADRADLCNMRLLWGRGVISSCINLLRPSP